MPRPAPGEVLDLDRYPLLEPQSGGFRDLVAHCQEELAEDGCCSLPAVFQEEAVAAIAAMARDRLELVHRPTELVSPYGGEASPDLPADHPRRARFRRGGGFLAADHLDPESGLWTFFQLPETTQFLEAVLQSGPLYPYADPISSMACNVMWPGDGFPWHFDTNEITLSIMVQAPDGGGVFEYCPNIRSPEQENDRAVAEIFAGGRKGVKQLLLQPGDLQIFKGRYTLHRVTEVTGNRPRIVALPSWSSKPGQVGVVERMQRSYGRALPIHYAKAAETPDALAH
ncbi:MAG: hypothetical protein AAFY02_21530 [Pseudomonadota bacterium]